LHFSDTASISYNFGRVGALTALYDSEQPWATYGGSGSTAVGSRIVGLSYTVQPMRDLQGYLSWLHPLGGVGSDTLVAGLSITLGHGTSGGVQWNRDQGASGERAFVQHSPPGPLGWSWLASGDDSSGGVRETQASWATERGTLGGSYVAYDGHASPGASVLTGVALLDGHAFWTRPVQNSFAVVDAGPVAGVRVYRENQLVGVTDSGGRLLVPDLQPFQTNHLSIDDRDLPISLGLASGAGTIAPPANAGVPVHFAVDQHPSLRLRLLLESGKPVPAGAALYLDGRALTLPVGYDGLVYADLSEGRHRLEARWPSGACRAQLKVSGPEGRVSPCAALP
jgi:outer membrane usher protein